MRSVRSSAGRARCRTSCRQRGGSSLRSRASGTKAWPTNSRQRAKRSVTGTTSALHSSCAAAAGYPWWLISTTAAATGQKDAAPGAGGGRRRHRPAAPSSARKPGNDRPLLRRRPACASCLGCTRRPCVGGVQRTRVPAARAHAFVMTSEMADGHVCTAAARRFGVPKLSGDSGLCALSREGVQFQPPRRGVAAAVSTFAAGAGSSGPASACGAAAGAPVAAP